MSTRQRARKPWQHMPVVLAVILLATIKGRAAAGGDLVGHWQFDQCDGKTVKDRSGGGNDGAIEYGQVRSEKKCASLELDGMGSRVTIANKTPILPAAALSVSLWVKPARLSNQTVLFGVPHVRDTWSTPVFVM